VYILRCCDDTLYVGHTNDLDAREATHNDGRGGTYTAARRPVRLAYSEEFDSIERAIAREQQIKGWTRDKKEALIAGDRTALKRLSRCRP
jgi:predicted GIY-YIG superfamily endonuclease